ncbi:MAG: hypothetical protein EZS28_001913 [Streblomastix strix]|uniref:Uncharacterized protein n=1 Tax=Streblomastix strix TaxID=222440 RepID=A0A5J4X6Q5_9EUKA|nr:MAG: hypothetical protein EZS28_001913 [Streblomastix strix]
METTLHSQRSAEQIEIMSIDSTSNQQRIQRNNRSFSNTQLSSSSRRQPIVKGKPKEKSARDSLLDQFTTVPTNAMEAYQNGDDGDGEWFGECVLEREDDAYLLDIGDEEFYGINDLDEDNQQDEDDDEEDDEVDGVILFGQLDF